MRGFWKLAAILGVAAGTVKAGPPSTGKEVFQRRCGGCHALDRDQEGPRLGGVFGRRAGSVASFAYSEGLKKSGVVWSEPMLDQWLTDTEKLVPGNDMSFRVENANERHEVILYLKENSGN